MMETKDQRDFSNIATCEQNFFFAFPIIYTSQPQDDKRNDYDVAFATQQFPALLFLSFFV